MRVVLIHRYFWPDTPAYAHILKEIALALGKAGHEVEVLTCQPSYNRDAVKQAPRRERLAPGVNVRRWSVIPDRRSTALKGVNLLIFCVRVLFARWRLGRVDVVMAASTPPVAIAKVGSWLARSLGAKFVYHKQDIYPDVVLAPGLMKAGPLAALLRWIDARTDRHADRVVVLSEDMALTLRDRGVQTDRVVSINNFDPWLLETTDEQPISRQSDETLSSVQPLTVVFAGNLGRFQNLETVMQAVVDLGTDEAIDVHFFGDGALRSHLEEEVSSRALRHIYVHGYQAPIVVAEFLRTKADLGLVSLAPGVIRAAYPSKTMSYLRHGCPVLALVEPESHLARTLVAAGAGFQTNPTDPMDVTKTIRYLAEHRDELVEAGKRAKQVYTQEFSGSHRLAEWVDLFALLEGRN